MDGGNAVSLTEVRREEDDELMGYLRCAGDEWAALTLFGGLLSVHPTEDQARDVVSSSGLSALAEPWWVRHGEDWWPCRVQEASPGYVRLWVTAHDYPHPSRVIQLEPPSPEVLQLHEPPPGD